LWLLCLSYINANYANYFNGKQNATTRPREQPTNNLVEPQSQLVWERESGGEREGEMAQPQ